VRLVAGLDRDLLVRFAKVIWIKTAWVIKNDQNIYVNPLTHRGRWDRDIVGVWKAEWPCSLTVNVHSVRPQPAAAHGQDGVANDARRFPLWAMQY
jgi:hypothetical protein